VSARFRLCTAPARCYRLGVETGTASCLTFLAADRQQRPLARPTSPLQTRVRGFCRSASGRSSSRRRRTSINAMRLRGCGYKTVSGRARWPNRDPLGELGFESIRSDLPSDLRTVVLVPGELAEGSNLYGFLQNDANDSVDVWGLGMIPPIHQHFPRKNNPPPPKKPPQPPQPSQPSQPLCFPEGTDPVDTTNGGFGSFGMGRGPQSLGHGDDPNDK
jgi:hypothetical protein